MELVARHLGDVLEIKTPVHRDDRGYFSVPFNAESAAALGITEPFVQDNHSLSITPGTIRGLHLQLDPWAQGKLVRVPQGRVLDVVVDLRPASPTCGQHVAIELSEMNAHQLWVPRGFAHGFCTLDPDSALLYKVDAPWNRDAERAIRWNDPTLGIDWPVSEREAMLSDKDAVAASFEEVLAEIQALEHWATS